MSDTYPTDCPCGSRCDGHAVAAPEDPGLEWDGIEAVTTEGEPYRIEIRYSDRSPREGWEVAWRVHRATR